MWVEDFVTGALGLFWLGWIGFLFLKATQIRRALQEQEAILRRSYQKAPEEAYLEPLAYLQASGWQASDALSRHDMISRWRASAQAARHRVSAYIEMMPQLGLLGTVVSLLLAATFFDFDTRTLGFALNTTIMGLIGALFGRWWIENPAEESYFNILELLQNSEVVSRLVHVVGRNIEPTSSEPSAPMPSPSPKAIVEATHTSNFSASPKVEASVLTEAEAPVVAKTVTSEAASTEAEAPVASRVKAVAVPLVEEAAPPKPAPKEKAPSKPATEKTSSKKTATASVEKSTKTSSEKTVAADKTTSPVKKVEVTVSEKVSTEETVATEKEMATEETVVTEKEVAAKKPIASEKPVASEKLAVVEKAPSVVVEKEVQAQAKTSTTSENAVAAENVVVAESTVVAEKTVVSENAVASEKTVVAQESPTSETSLVADVPAVVKETVVVEDPAPVKKLDEVEMAIASTLEKPEPVSIIEMITKTPVPFVAAESAASPVVVEDSAPLVVKENEPAIAKENVPSVVKGGPSVVVEDAAPSVASETLGSPVISEQATSPAVAEKPTSVPALPKPSLTPWATPSIPTAINPATPVVLEPIVPVATKMPVNPDVLETSLSAASEVAGVAKPTAEDAVKVAGDAEDTVLEEKPLIGLPSPLVASLVQREDERSSTGSEKG
ncbi:MAG: hypothetical protein H6728_05585 [Myxococcales bacterium]|nr:hypothetical protein [Myxococcales bacterium]